MIRKMRTVVRRINLYDDFWDDIPFVLTKKQCGFKVGSKRWGRLMRRDTDRWLDSLPTIGSLPDVDLLDEFIVLPIE